MLALSTPECQGGVLSHFRWTLCIEHGVVHHVQGFIIIDSFKESE